MSSKNRGTFFSHLGNTRIPVSVKYVNEAKMKRSKHNIQQTESSDSLSSASRMQTKRKKQSMYKANRKDEKQCRRLMTLLNGVEDTVRMTRATSKLMEQPTGTETQSSSSSDRKTNLSKLIRYRYPSHKHILKRLHRKCKNRYYSMAQLARKLAGSDSESDDSTDIDSDDITNALNTDLLGIHDQFEKSTRKMDKTLAPAEDIHQVEIGTEDKIDEPVQDLNTVRIFESESGSDEDKNIGTSQQTPVKTVPIMREAPIFGSMRDDSLRPNPVKRQLFQVLHVPNQPRKRNKIEKEKKCTESDIVTNTPATGKMKKFHVEVLEDEDDDFIEIESQMGRLVFANLVGLQWWPGIIVKGSMCHLYTEDKGCSWVYWFGDHKVSLVPQERIIPFAANFIEKSNGKGKMFQKALYEVLKVYGERIGLNTITMSNGQLIEWAQTEFRLFKGSKHTEAETDKNIPDAILRRLEEIGANILKKVEGKPVPKSKHDKMEERISTENAIDVVKEGKCEIKDICIGCSDLSVTIVGQHPLFKGGVCKNCKVDILETIYALDEDGIMAYCSICGHGGTVFLCDKAGCNRVYCVECIDEMAGSDILAEIEKKKTWECFLCCEYNPKSHGLIEPNKDWQQRIIQFFETEMIHEIPTYDMFKTKQPIRVLSLFDGIGTGILVLRELGLDVEEYYASEIDSDAMIVTSVHHGDIVQQIGDITEITEDMISSMLPIDLLLGASPCNDLSLANPDRKGFNFGGTGILFFDFVRILEIVRKLQTKQRHLFWLFENVASMKLEYKKVISRFLKCPAAMWNSGYFSAQNRSRYFWGNIPGLFSTPSVSSYNHEKVTLDSFLTKKCKRQATVDKLRTVTTRTNSLRLGKDDKGFPIKMAGQDAGIWIPELERVFGFPSHYTDVQNLPSTRRQKLLGKAWSVTVLKNILKPLKQYFQCSVDDVQEENKR